MPELPEVETTRRGLSQIATHVRIHAVAVGKPLRWPLNCPPELLIGLEIQAWSRRAKYLIAHLDQGYLLIHLGMSGSLRFGTQLPPKSKHDHFVLYTHSGELRLNDPRRFGCVVFVDRLDHWRAMQLLGHLGLEPLTQEFTLQAFTEKLKQKRGPVKQVLLAGSVVVGVGNIYASEVLFLSGIHPQTPIVHLTPDAIQRLHEAIPSVLNHALAQGGTTLRNYANALGHSGEFQNKTLVYGRAEEPCTQCVRGQIQRLIQQQRSTYYCPVCQPPHKPS